MVAGALAEEKDLPEGVLAAYAAQILPPTPDEVTGESMHRWLEALPTSLVAFMLPLIELAGYAVAVLAVEREQTREEALAEIADMAWGGE